MICTLAEIKAFLGITSTDYDDELNNCLSAAQKYLENETNRSFEKVTIEKTFLSDGRNSFFIAPPIYFEVGDYVKIDSEEKENDTDFFVNSTTGEIAFFSEIPANLKVEIKINSGFENAPDDIKRAVLETAAQMYKNKGESASGAVKSKKLADYSIEYETSGVEIQSIADKIIANYKIFNI